jgi:OOP family OmpA-OmpF porin
MTSDGPTAVEPADFWESAMIGRRLASAVFGLLLLTGAAPPAMAAMRQAQASHAARPTDFVVFFGSGGASLTHSGATVVARAAVAVKQALVKVPGSHVKVIGYSDTSGTDDGAQRLSERRAATVRDSLVQDGVDAAKIATEGRGKSELAVATPDRTREPRNRRVRIVVYGPTD